MMTHAYAACRPSAAGQHVLVTGGAGFIGSHLCEALLLRGARVTCLDDLSTGSLDNLSALLGREGFRFLRADVCDLPCMEVDRIYNLACPASPFAYQRDPLRTLKTSVLGANAVLELARRTGARVLLASTSEVYGDPLHHPQHEDHWGNVNPIGPRACYDEGKRCAETLFFDHHRVHGTPIRVARIFNTYGPRLAAEDGRVVSTFIRQALRGEALTVFGEGRQTRSLCFVSDMVAGLMALMEAEGDARGPFNLGNPEEVTVMEIARRVLAMTGSRSRIIHLPLPQDDPVRRRPDIGRARAALGWSPRVPLEDGLRRTIAASRMAEAALA